MEIASGCPIPGSFVARLPRVPLLILTALLLAMAPAAPPSSENPPAEPEPKPPNLVVFLVDDLGWQDVSVPLHTETTPLNRRYRTPNLERLAERGVRFTNGYASAPVCTPTRAALLTGQMPGRSHITYWILNKDKDQSAKFPGLEPPAWRVNGLQPDDVTLPRLLRQAGYRTIHVGKAHWGAKDTPGEDPRNLGFDVNVAGHGAGAPGSFLGKENYSAKHRKGNRVWDVPGLEKYHGTDTYLTEALTKEAVKAVTATAATGQPFFLHFAPYAVHTPITANPKYAKHYEHLPKREAAYATMIESVDAALGELVALFDHLKVADNTVIVFTSDNGGLSAHGRDGEKHTHNAPLRSGKGSAYEGGIRVPWVVAWPGVTDESRACHEPVITHDLFPTMLELAGVEVPEAYAPQIDGQSLLPILKGRDRFAEPRDLIWNQPHFWGVQGPGIQPFTALRRGRWKLLFWHSDRALELYDLASDPGETRDLSDEQSSLVADLGERMKRRVTEANVQLSLDSDRHEPIAVPRVQSR